MNHKEIVDMIKNTIFVCERCGFSSSNLVDIEICEAHHLSISQIINCTEFEITEQHLKLLQRQTVRFEECGEIGASEVNHKRPYGNSFIEDDMAKILGITGEDVDCEYQNTLSDRQIDYLHRLHIETTIALQICLQHLNFEPGKFVREPKRITGKWKKL